MDKRFQNDLTEAINMFSSLLDGEREEVLQKMRGLVKRIPA